MFEARTRPKPSSYSTRTPSMVTISRAPGNFASARQPRHHLGRLAFDARHVELRRRNSSAARSGPRSDGARANDVEQPRRRVGGVVEAVPALAGDMRASRRRAARRSRASSPDQPGNVHIHHGAWHAAGAQYDLALLRALDVVEDRRAAPSLQDVAREQHQLAIGIDVLASLVTTPGGRRRRRRPGPARRHRPGRHRSARPGSPACWDSGWWFGKSPSTSSRARARCSRARAGCRARTHRRCRCRSRPRSSSAAPACSR